MKLIYIFDLDGLIADTRHRAYLLNADADEEGYIDVLPIITGHLKSGSLSRESFYFGNTSNAIRRIDENERWSKYYELCEFDKPIELAIHIFSDIYQGVYSFYSQSESPHLVQIWTGRSEVVRDKTLDWISKNIGISDVHLKMRKVDDTMCENKIKEIWLKELLSKIDQKEVMIISFTNKKRDIEMFRSYNIKCISLF